QNLTNINGTLYFSATDSSGGNELWKSDGTETGTIRVKDIFSGTASSNPNNLTYVNGKLYFFADNGNTGQELFKLDLNNTPTDLSLSATSINENVPADTVIGNFSTTDADTDNTHTYTLVSGADSTDNSAFAIVGNELHINVSPDYETKNSYNIRLRTTDRGGLFYEKAIAIAVNNINDAPTVANGIADQTATTDTTFNFNLPANTFADEDAADNLTYSATLENGESIPSWLTWNGTTLSGTPTNYSVASLNIKIIASDGTTDVSDIFALTVVNSNDASTTFNDSITTNELNGDIESDNLIGGLGNGTLFGGVGEDVLLGETERHSFKLTTNAHTRGHDIIANLTIGNGTIFISKAEFGLGQSQDTILDSGFFRLGTSARTTGDRFIYDRTTGNLFFDKDGVGGTAQVKIAHFSN
ncbi:ELWxxDGT repeat protein, partial [Nostoc sp.]|uniref:ELWxxDGT repeat protein n=1 Tax=Nostoc sp. TaxID=1180 RepID=UPI002FF445CB